MQESPWKGCRQVWSEEDEHPRCILLQSRLRSKDNKPMHDENFFIISEFGNLILILKKTQPPFTKGAAVIAKIKNIAGRKSDFWATASTMAEIEGTLLPEIPGSDIINFFEVLGISMVGHGDCLNHGGPIDG